MEELYAYRRQIMARAREQLQQLYAGVGKIEPESMHTALEEGGWSVHQVLAHMRDVELQAFWPRVKDMLQHEQPDLQYFDEGAWMQEHYDEQEPVQTILTGFQEARLKMLAALEGADPQGWSRSGRHPTQGLRTVQWWFEYTLSHTEDHLAQMSIEVSDPGSAARDVEGDP